MLEYFEKIKEKIFHDGEQVKDKEWQVEGCIFEVIGEGIERIYAPGLVDVVKEGAEFKISEGSKDSLKFLSVVI